MMRVVVAALAALCVWTVAPAVAHADVLDEVIEFYNPDLKPARPIITCAINGGAVQTCAADAVKNQLVTASQAKLAQESGGTVGQIVELSALVNAGKYHEVIAKAGIVAACAWMTFPAKDYLCSDIAGELAKAGSAAAAATASVVTEAATALASAIGSVGKEVVCLITGCSSGGGGTKVTVDTAAAWNSCYVPRLREGVRARVGGGANYARLVSFNITDGLFPSGSLVGGCSNGLLTAIGTAQPTLPPLGINGGPGPFSIIQAPPPKPQAPTPAEIAFAKARQNDVAIQLQATDKPMVDRFRGFVETAAVEVLEPAVDQYRALQDEWLTRAKVKAAGWFLATVPLGLAVNGERRACEQALNTDAARSIARWAESGAVIGSQTQLKGRDERDWRLADAPQPWCQAKYVAAFNASIAARRAAYQEALAGGCETVDGDPKHLRCGAITTALAKCIAAFADSAESGHCAATPVRLQPLGPLTAPPATAPPTTAPAEITTQPVQPQPGPVAPRVQPRTRITPVAPVTPPAAPRG